MGLDKGESLELNSIVVMTYKNGEFVLKNMAIGYVVYSIQTGVSLNRCHYIKGNHLLSKHAFIEILNTTKVHRRT